MRGRSRFTCPDRGRAKVGTHHLGHAPTPGPKTRLAQVPAAQARQEAGQKLDGSCPVPAHHRLPHLSRTPGPPLITHTCPGPSGSQGYQPTCQPANRLENAAATGKRVGAGYITVIHLPCFPSIQVKTGRPALGRYVPYGLTGQEGGKDHQGAFPKVGRHGVHRQWHAPGRGRALQE